MKHTPSNWQNTISVMTLRIYTQYLIIHLLKFSFSVGTCVTFVNKLLEKHAEKGRQHNIENHYTKY